MNPRTRRLFPGVIEIDTLLGGLDEMTAGYLIEGEAPLLIETGSKSSFPALLEALTGLGVGPDDLAGVAVTHIHLDHAGGVGDVQRAFPKATVYVHELGAAHLVDPTRLISSAARVYGELLDGLYGRLDPTPAERITALHDGEAIDLGGGRRIEVLESPGHAKHHLAFFDQETGSIFTGDAAGVKLPGIGMLRPATPPPDFDLDAALASLRRFSERSPEHVLLAHYGLVPGGAEDLLSEAEDGLRAWSAVAEEAAREGRDVEGALRDAFTGELDALSGHDRERVEVLNGIHSNAMGLTRWLRTRGDHAGH